MTKLIMPRLNSRYADLQVNADAPYLPRAQRDGKYYYGYMRIGTYRPKVTTSDIRHIHDKFLDMNRVRSETTVVEMVEKINDLHTKLEKYGMFVITGRLFDVARNETLIQPADIGWLGE